MQILNDYQSLASCWHLWSTKWKGELWINEWVWAPGSLRPNICCIIIFQIWAR